jgi:hypothetical protein
VRLLNRCESLAVEKGQECDLSDGILSGGSRSVALRDKPPLENRGAGKLSSTLPNLLYAVQFASQLLEGKMHLSIWTFVKSSIKCYPVALAMLAQSFMEEEQRRPWL